jgi:hypothetical protein
MCQANAAACDRNSVTTCNANGSGYVGGTTPCGAGLFCLSGQCGSPILFDDFEDGDTNGWSPSPTSCATVSVNSTLGAASTARSVQFRVTQTCPTDSYFTRSLSPTQVRAVGYWFRTSLVGYGIVLELVAQNVAFAHANTVALTRLSSNVWYYMEIKNIDYQAQTFDVFLDGVLIERLPFERQATAAEAVRVKIWGTQVGSITSNVDEVALR